MELFAKPGAAPPSLRCCCQQGRSASMGVAGDVGVWPPAFASFPDVTSPGPPLPSRLLMLSSADIAVRSGKSWRGREAARNVSVCRVERRSFARAAETSALGDRLSADEAGWGEERASMLLLLRAPRMLTPLPLIAEGGVPGTWLAATSLYECECGVRGEEAAAGDEGCEDADEGLLLALAKRCGVEERCATAAA